MSKMFPQSEKGERGEGTKALMLALKEKQERGVKPAMAIM